MKSVKQPANSPRMGNPPVFSERIFCTFATDAAQLQSQTWQQPRFAWQCLLPLSFIGAAHLKASASHRRPQMDFRQACNSQMRREPWRLQQANYGSCIFAVRPRNLHATTMLPCQFCSMLPVQYHASAHPLRRTTDPVVRNCRSVQRHVVAALGEARGVGENVATSGLV